MLRQFAIACAALGMLLQAVSRADAQLTVVDSFTSGLGALVAIGREPVSGHLFVYPEFGASIHEFTPAGVEVLPRIPRPGASSNDIDLAFAPTALDIGGTTVPAGTLLVFNGEDSPPTLRGLDRDTGAVLAQVALSNVDQSDVVGGVYHPGRNTVFVLDWASDVVRELLPSTGAQVSAFAVDAPGSPSYDIFYGDLELTAAGTLLLVSSAEQRVRELTVTGEFVRDVAVPDVVAAGAMAGLAIDPATGHLWVATRAGHVYQLSEPAPRPLAHFLCHQAKTRAGTPKLIPGPVALQDGFAAGPVQAEVQKTASLCTPAAVAGQPPLDPDTHLKSYRIKPAVRPAPVAGLLVSNGLGTLSLDTVKPDRLLVPAASSAAGPVAPPDPAGHTVDHFQCHTAKVTPGTPKFPKGITLALADGLADGTYALTKPTRLCSPADRDGQGVVDATALLVCYKASRRSGTYQRPPEGLFAADAFGDERLDAVKEQEICVPSQLAPPPGP